MHVVIFEPASRETILVRRLGPDEMMDHRSFAEAVTRKWGGAIDDGPGHVACCSGDVRVEFREDPDDDRRISSGRSFFLA